MLRRTVIAGYGKLSTAFVFLADDAARQADYDWRHEYLVVARENALGRNRDEYDNAA